MIITKLLWKESRKKNSIWNRNISRSDDDAYSLERELFFVISSYFFQRSFFSWCYAFIIGYSLSNFLNHTSSFLLFFSSFLSISSTPLHSSPRSYIELNRKSKLKKKNGLKKKKIKYIRNVSVVDKTIQHVVNRRQGC